MYYFATFPTLPHFNFTLLSVADKVSDEVLNKHGRLQYLEGIMLGQRVIHQERKGSRSVQMGKTEALPMTALSTFGRKLSEVIEFRKL